MGVVLSDFLNCGEALRFTRVLSLRKYSGKPLSERQPFDSTDVAVRACWAGDPALIEIVDRRCGADGIDPCINRCTARARLHREGGSAVVLQGAKHRVGVDAGAGGVGIAEVASAVEDAAGAVSTSRAVGYDRVPEHCHRVGVSNEYATAVGSLIA